MKEEHIVSFLKVQDVLGELEQSFSYEIWRNQEKKTISQHHYARHRSQNRNILSSNPTSPGLCHSANSMYMIGSPYYQEVV